MRRKRSGTAVADGALKLASPLVGDVSIKDAEQFLRMWGVEGRSLRGYA